MQLRADVGVQRECAIERALNGRDAREIRARIGLQFHGTQAAGNQARFGEHQNREHYVETPGDGNRRKPPARVSSSHCSTPLRRIAQKGIGCAGVDLRAGSANRPAPRDAVLRFHRTGRCPGVSHRAASDNKPGVAADGRGIGGDRLLGRHAMQVVRTTRLRARARKPHAAEWLHADHRADHVAIDVDVADA